jgi:hypothetical protein
LACATKASEAAATATGWQKLVGILQLPQQHLEGMRGEASTNMQRMQTPNMVRLQIYFGD